MKDSIADLVFVILTLVGVVLLIHKDALLEHEINKLKMVQISLQSRLDVLEGFKNAK